MKVLLLVLVILLFLCIYKARSFEGLDADRLTNDGINKYVGNGSSIPEEQVAFQPAVQYKLIPVKDTIKAQPKKCSVNIYSPVKNGYMSKIYPRKRSTIIESPTNIEPVKMVHFAKYNDMLPKIDPNSYFHVEQDQTLEYALNKTILDPKYGAVIYDKKRAAAMYYPYMNYGNSNIGSLQEISGYDTYIKI